MRRLFNKPYSHVRLRRGYTKAHMLFELNGIEKSTDKNDLNLPEVYKICHGAMIEA